MEETAVPATFMPDFEIGHIREWIYKSLKFGNHDTDVDTLSTAEFAQMSPRDFYWGRQMQTKAIPSICSILKELAFDESNSQFIREASLIFALISRQHVSVQEAIKVVYIAFAEGWLTKVNSLDSFDPVI